jgi:hypothetical protein
METHFKGPRGDYRCMNVARHRRNGWSVEKIVDGKTHIVSMNMTRADAFKHARGMSGLQHDKPNIVVVDIPEEQPTDRRGLVAHSRKL